MTSPTMMPRAACLLHPEDLRPEDFTQQGSVVSELCTALAAALATGDRDGIAKVAWALAAEARELAELADLADALA